MSVIRTYVHNETVQPQTKQWYLLRSMSHSRRYDFQGHPSSWSRSGDDLSPSRDYFLFFR